MSYRGDENNPVDFNFALSWSRIGPDDTVYVRGGTYSGHFASSLAGSAGHPITIKPYPGETVIIDGTFDVNGIYTDWHDIEFKFSGWVDRDNSLDPNNGVNVYGDGSRLINCVIHDTGNNGSWANSGGGFYECVIYNCGYKTGATNHGHAIYTQNDVATLYHHNNICWGQYGFGLHGYTAAGQVDYFDWRNNICFRNTGRQLALGGLGGQRAHNCVLDGNVMLEGDGYLKGNDITLTNNYSPSGFTIEGTSQNVTESGNTFTEQATNRVLVFPLTYKTGAHIAIFNPEGLDTVTVDVSGVTGLTGYRLRNAQDYYTDVVVTGTTEGTIAVDMRAASHTVAARIGSTAVETTFPAFGCFVLEAT